VLVDDQAEAVEASELVAKTLNNTLVTSAPPHGLTLDSPARTSSASAPPTSNVNTFRLHEIPIYLDSCSDVAPSAQGSLGSKP
jgi:hypothetical protein